MTIQQFIQAHQKKDFGIDGVVFTIFPMHVFQQQPLWITKPEREPLTFDSSMIIGNGPVAEPVYYNYLNKMVFSTLPFGKKDKWQIMPLCYGVDQLFKIFNTLNNNIPARQKETIIFQLVGKTEAAEYWLEYFQNVYNHR
jgi:hypothetical protein